MTAPDSAGGRAGGRQAMAFPEPGERSLPSDRVSGCRSLAPIRVWRGLAAERSASARGLAERSASARVVRSRLIRVGAGCWAMFAVPRATGSAAVSVRPGHGLLELARYGRGRGRPRWRGRRSGRRSDGRQLEIPAGTLAAGCPDTLKTAVNAPSTAASRKARSGSKSFHAPILGGGTGTVGVSARSVRRTTPRFYRQEFVAGGGRPQGSKAFARFW